MGAAFLLGRGPAASAVPPPCGPARPVSSGSESSTSRAYGRRRAGPIIRTTLAAVFLGVAAPFVRAQDQKPHAFGAQLVRREQLPLHTAGRYIVDRYNDRVKWACVNWYGTYSPGQMVVGGLEMQPMEVIVKRIRSEGFNCVRLPYSTQGYYENPLITEPFVRNNSHLAGMTFLEAFDYTIKMLTLHGLMVIINNHISRSTWCCLYTSEEGLWYTKDWSEQQWIGSLVGLAERYADNPLVVGYDLRNEPHDYGQVRLTWGDGNNQTDLARAMETAGNAVLAKVPNVLIVIEGLCFASDLRGISDHPIELSIPNRVVYEVHNYQDFNFFMLLNHEFFRLENLQMCTILLSLFLVLYLAILTKAWCMIGCPKPPKGLVAFTCGGFSSVFGLLTLIAFVIIKKLSVINACDFGTQKDTRWIYHLGLAQALFGAMLLVIGICRMQWRQGRRQEERTAGHESDRWWYAGGWNSCFTLCRQVRQQWGPKNRLRTLSMEESASSDEDPEVTKPDETSKVRFHRRSNCESASSDEDPEVTKPDETSKVRFHRRSNCESVNASGWDNGVCIGFFFFILAILVLIPLLVLSVMCKYVLTFEFLAQDLDKRWGFVLEQNIAPVWMGEFGEGVRGTYWMSIARYLSERDVDFGYWAWNGRAWKDVEVSWSNTHFWGTITAQVSGVMKARAPHWVDEGWGLMKEDYITIRRPWLMMDLQALMTSPVNWKKSTKLAGIMRK